MDQLERKTFTTSRNLTYTYYGTPKSNGSDRPTLLLQHGFPDDHNLWAQVLPALLALPHPIIAPDLLGFNGTSKPTDPSMYNSKAMSDDLIEILDHEVVRSIISVGHDWGSFMAQRMYLWHPDRVIGMINLNVSYMAPSEFNLEQVNIMTEKYTGLPRLAYWELFTAPDAPEVMNSHLEAFYNAFHGAAGIEQMCCTRGTIRDFVINDRRRPLKDYAKDPVYKEEWLARYKRDGIEAPLQWYHAMHQGHHWAVEKELSKEELVVKVPVLFIGASGDAVCQTENVRQPQEAGQLPDLVIEEVTSGHWQTLEVPEQTSAIMVKWLKEKNFKV